MLLCLGPRNAVRIFYFGLITALDSLLFLYTFIDFIKATFIFSTVVTVRPYDFCCLSLGLGLLLVVTYTCCAEMAQLIS